MQLNTNLERVAKVLFMGLIGISIISMGWVTAIGSEPKPKICVLPGRLR